MTLPDSVDEAISWPHTTCPHCGRGFRPDSAFRGGEMACPGCLTMLDLGSPRITAPRLLIRAYLSSWLNAPLFETDADYQKANRWAELYSPQGRDENGEVVLEFAKERYLLIAGLLDDHDKKADELMRTTLAVFGAFLAAVSAKILPVEGFWIVPAIFGLAVLGCGILVAAVARIPAPLSTPMSAKALTQVSDLPILPSKSQLQSALAASYHSATVGATILHGWKTRQLRRASRIFLAGLAVLFISVMGGIRSRPRTTARCLSSRSYSFP